MAKAQPQFTKIVNNSKQVHIEWITRKRTASEAEEQHNHQLECQEKPRPEFDTALQAFKPFLLEIIGAPADWKAKTVVTGISLNKEEDRRRGIIITAKRTCPFGAAPIALNTPHLRESLDETKETGPNFLLPGMVNAIDAMCEEAQIYLDGDRSQGELFGDEEKEEKKSRRGKSGEPELVGSITGRLAGSRS